MVNFPGSTVSRETRATDGQEACLDLIQAVPPDEGPDEVVARHPLAPLISAQGPNGAQIREEALHSGGRRIATPGIKWGKADTQTGCVFAFNSTRMNQARILEVPNFGREKRMCVVHKEGLHAL